MKKFNGYIFLNREKIQESILDIPKDKLCPLLWDDNEQLKPEVKEFVVKTFNDWQESIKTNFNIVNMVLIGGSASYQYTESSDFDVNVTASGISEDEITNLGKILPNGNLIPGTKHPLNFYLTIDNKAIEHSDDAYDILNDKWVKHPSKENVSIPYSYITEITKLFASSIDLKIEEIMTDTNELEYYQNLLESGKFTTDKQDIEKRIAFKKEEILADKDALRLMKYMIHAFRKEAFDDVYNVKFSINIDSNTPNFSMNNAIYKMLEKLGYYDKIDAMIK